MTRAWGIVNALVREGVLVYEAVYQESYRHNARRISSSDPGQMWTTETAAVQALARTAGGAPITIQAGAYPRGTRRRGDVLEAV